MVEEILIHCIDDIKAGRATLAGCLERYPDARAELEPLLKVALSIKEKPDIKPSEAFKIRARANLMDHIRASQLEKKVPLTSSQPNKSFGWFTSWARAVAVTVVVILVVAAAGTGTAYASQSSLPGDTLYSVKLGTEQLQRIFTFDTTAEVELELKFASIRLDEMEQLASMLADQASIFNSGGGRILTMSVIGFMPKETEKSYITQVERIEQAAAGYEKNLNMAITKSETMPGNAELLEKLALAILTHFDRLDEIGDKASGEMAQIIASSKIITLNGHQSAVQNLAAVNPVRANEINQQAIQNRLERAQTESKRGNSQGYQEALQELGKLRQFGNEIPNQTGGEGQNHGTNSDTNSPTPEERHKAPNQDSGQSSQGNTGDTSPSNQQQDTQNQPQQGGQSNPTTVPPTSVTIPGGSGGSAEQPGNPSGATPPENTPNNSGDGPPQPGGSSGETSNPPQQSGESSSGSGRK